MIFEDFGGGGGEEYKEKWFIVGMSLHRIKTIV